MAKANILLVLSFSGEHAPFTTGKHDDPPETHTTLALPLAFATLARIERKGLDLPDPTEASSRALALSAAQHSFPDSWSLATTATTQAHIWIDGHWHQIQAADEFGFGFRVTYRNPASGVFVPYHGTLAGGNIGYDLFAVVQNA